MKKLLSVLFITLLTACGSSGSSDGMLIEGTLTEAGGAAHKQFFKHAENQKIEEVTICALGQCSITDTDGQWGFVVSKDFTGGHAEFTVNGHGINTTSSIHIPENAQNVFIELQHVEGGKVEAHKITADGVEQEDHHSDDMTEEHSHE